VPAAELDSARRHLTPEFHRAVSTAAANIRRYAQRQMPQDWTSAAVTDGSPLLMRLLRTPLDGRTAAQFWQYMLFRQLPAPLGSTDFVLAIRPEHVAFAPSGVAGEIAASTFLGERSHFHICLPGRSEPVAVSGHAPPPGAVYLAFPPEKLIGLPA